MRRIEPFGATVRIVAGDDRRRRRWSERLVHHVPVQVEVVADPAYAFPATRRKAVSWTLTYSKLIGCSPGTAAVSIAFSGTRRSPASPRSRVKVACACDWKRASPRSSQSLCSVRSTLLSDPELLLGREHRGRGEARDRRVRRIPERRPSRIDAQREADGGVHAERRHDEHHELPALRREERARAEQELEKVAVVLGCLGWRGLRGLGWQVVRDGGGRRPVRCARDRCGRRDRSGKGTDERREDEPAAR